jgi:LPPG:FO 2-phospho-L-lactate transferase
VILALAGGVGGAKLADGLAQVLAPDELQLVVNTGDDFRHLQLDISPDLDTVMYTLAGIANPDTGWGQRAETWEFMAALERLGGPAWFRLGDRDLATHVERTRRLAAGETISEVTRDFCRRLGIRHEIVPMSDESVRTVVRTDSSELEFQRYFVELRCEPRARGVEYRGAADARPSEPLRGALSRLPEGIIICPSNPFLSVAPILAVPGVRAALEACSNVVAVSPIIAGRALKGPAAKLMSELGFEATAAGVARYYRGLVRHLVIDRADAALVPAIEALGMRAVPADAVMNSTADRARLASLCVDLVRRQDRQVA